MNSNLKKLPEKFSNTLTNVQSNGNSLRLTVEFNQSNSISRIPISQKYFVVFLLLLRPDVQSTAMVY